MKKILFITSSSINGGAQKHIRDMFIELLRKGFDVYLVAPKGWLIDELHEYEKKCFILKVNFKNIHKLRNIMDKIRPDIINTFILSGGCFGYFAWLKNKTGRIFITVNNPVCYDGISRTNKIIFPLLYKWLNKKCTLFLTKSDAVKEEVSEVIGNREKVISIKNGIDFSVFDMNKKYESIKDELNLPQDAIIVTNIGALDKRKGQYYFIESAKFLTKKYNNIYFLIAGSGEEESALIRQISDLGLNERVILLGSRKDINRILSFSNVFVLSSLHEGLPNVLIEAMSMGVPCVATDVGGVRQLIDDGINGLIISPKSTKDIENAVIKLLDQPDISQYIMKNAYDKIKKSYELHAVTNELIKIYQLDEFKTNQRIHNSIPYRVLIIINSMDAGGAETFVMKIYRTINKNEIQFDFLINNKEKCFYEDEIAKMGGEVYRGISKSKKPLKSFLFIYRTIKSNKYNSVFCIAVHPLVALDLLAAKLAGAHNCLVRSTNSSAGDGILSYLLAKVFRPFVCKLSTVRFAPSTEAAIWLFGKKCVNKKRVKLINNGIESSIFKFDNQKRLNMRRALNIENNFVVGHIGRFNHQKNHTFLIKVFSELCKISTSAILLLVGTGELENDIKNQIEELGIGDKVIFTGIRNDIPKLLMAMDVLVFPSLYEGMPNVVIEAQATGLPCIISDTITAEVKITSLVKFKSLNSIEIKWVDAILQSQKIYNREDFLHEVIDKGYDIRETTKIILNHISGD